LDPESGRPGARDDRDLGMERRAVDGFKSAARSVFGVALQTYGKQLAEQQEVLLHLADMLIDVFTAESAVLRAAATAGTHPERAPRPADAARVFVTDAASRLHASGGQALAAMLEGDTLDTALGALHSLSHRPINTAAARRRLADAAVARGRYIF